MQRKALSSPDLKPDAALLQDMFAVTQLVRGSTETPLFITQDVASGMEENLLGRLDPHEFIPGTNKFVFDRLGGIEQEKATIADLRHRAAPLLVSGKVSESELKQYLRRSAMEGDVEAMKWLLSRHPEP